MSDKPVDLLMARTMRDLTRLGKQESEHQGRSMDLLWPAFALERHPLSEAAWRLCDVQRESVEKDNPDTWLQLGEALAFHNYIFKAFASWFTDLDKTAVAAVSNKLWDDFSTTEYRDDDDDWIVYGETFAALGLTRHSDWKFLDAAIRRATAMRFDAYNDIERARFLVNVVEVGRIVARKHGID